MSARDHAQSWKQAIPYIVNRLLVATPQEGLELETEYELTIGQSALSASGGAGLEKTASSSFTTVPFPAVKQTYPSNGEVASPWQRGVSIDFVSSMDFETLEDKITIIPEPEEVTYYYNEWIDEFDPTYSSFNLKVHKVICSKQIDLFPFSGTMNVE